MLKALRFAWFAAVRIAIGVCALAAFIVLVLLVESAWPFTAENTLGVLLVALIVGVLLGSLWRDVEDRESAADVLDVPYGQFDYGDRP